MEKKIAQILKGQFEYQQPELLFSQKKLRQVLAADEIYAGEFYIGTEENIKLRGYVKSTNVRIQTEVETLSGSTIKIPYTVNMNGLTAGDTVKGWLCFITNIGESRLPFEFEVENESLSDDTGHKMSMEEFCALTKNNFREAYRLFTDERFFSLLEDASVREKTIYLGMSKQPVTYQHLEEYLIAIGQKDPVTIMVPDEPLKFFELKDTIQERFVIRRSGWGHLRMDVECHGDFLEVSKNVVTDDDFIGSTYQGSFIIHRDRLRDGKKTGEIILRTPYQECRISIVASTEANLSMINRVHTEKKHRIALVKDYIDYQLGQLEMSAWASASQYEINQLKEYGFDYPEYQFYQAYLYHCQGNDEEAKLILSQYMNRQYSRDDLELAGFYLYACLETGMYKNRDHAVERIQSFFRQKSDSFVLFWILMQIDPSVRDFDSTALYMMEELFEKGCRSPLLYQAAWTRIEQDISLLHRMTPFSVQVFLFAARRNRITEELAMRCAYLTGYQKAFQESTYMVLCHVAEKYPTDDIIESLCKYIMKGNPREKRHFTWFSKAIKQGIRLTRLYESYIETMDISYQRELPKPLLMYFSYNNHTLGESRKAFIYACVIANKQKDPDSYENYLETIRAFAIEKLHEGYMDENFAVIYQDVFEKVDDPDTAEELAKCLFTNRLYCEDSKVRYVVVRHSQLSDEELYPCIHGIAYPRIYTEDAQILFQDENQRRYVTTVSYNLQKLMDERRVFSSLIQAGVSDVGTLLHYCEDSSIEKKNLNIYLNIARMEAFSDKYRLEQKKEILSYYTKYLQRGESLEEIPDLDYASYVSVDENSVIQILIGTGMHNEALELIKTYGCEQLQTSLLMKLVAMILDMDNETEDPYLVAFAASLLQKDIYNKNTLRYLTAYETGTIDDLLYIWKKDLENNLDTLELEEKLLALLVFTGDYRKDGMAVFGSYVKHMENLVIASGYLTHMVYGAFVKEFPMDDFMKERLLIAYQEDWPVDKVCHYALLKVLTKERSKSSKHEELKKELLAECMRDGMTFSFFRKLSTVLLEPYQMDDKAIVEYHAAPEDRVVLYYALDNGLGLPLEYKSEPMHNMYSGIYTKTFTLFYGETLHYYFKVQHKGKKKTTSERVLTMNRADGSSMNKYQMINQILSARRLDKKDEAVSQMRQYLRQEQYVREMFPIIEET